MRSNKQLKKKTIAPPKKGAGSTAVAGADGDADVFEVARILDKGVDDEGKDIFLVSSMALFP